MQIANHEWNALQIFGLQEAWNTEAARSGRKGRSLFVATTYQAYNTDLQIGTYNAMHFSTGRLFCIRNPRVKENADGTCTLEWQDNSEGNIARSDDHLRVLVVRESNPDARFEIKGLTVTRADGSVTFNPRTEPSLSGATHLYVFFQSADGKMFSPDEHLVLW